MGYKFKHFQDEGRLSSDTIHFRRFHAIWDTKVLLDNFQLVQNSASLTIASQLAPISLSITADDCKGMATTTTIHWTMVYSTGSGTTTMTGTDRSSSFPQNTSRTETIQRTTTYSRDGLSASATFTQGVWTDEEYTLTLSGISTYGFEKDQSILLLDQTIYDGPYKSLNYNINSSYATARIDLSGYTSFTIWINSYAESSYDYTVASQLNASTYPTSYSNGYTGNGYSATTSFLTGKYSNTSNFQKNPQEGLSETNWRKITYTLDGGVNYLYITYLKDSSELVNTDRGHFVIERG